MKISEWGRWVVVWVVMMVCVEGWGQFYSTGPDPLRTRWVRLEGDNWRIDVGEGVRRWGLLADSVLREVAPLIVGDFDGGLRMRRIDVVVHGSAAYSNGLVSWAPKRLEAYGYDTGGDDCVPWVRHLMTHEYRHVAQTQMMIRGFSRFLYGLFGEQSVGLIGGLFVPRWSLEGDAVWAETRYTRGGRGRESMFVQQMRALVMDSVVPSYSQAYFGSYGRRVPDYYHLGYLMVGEVSDTLGNGLWGEALGCAGRRPFTIVPYVRALRKRTGYRPMGLYRWAVGRASRRWGEEMRERVGTGGRVVLETRGDYEELLHTRPYRGGYVQYVSSPSEVAHFEVRDSVGRELGRIVPSVRNETHYTLHGDTVVWSERRQHCRWSNASENCLMMGDLRTGRVSRLTWGENFHSPALSGDGGRIAAVRSNEDLSHEVVVMGLGGGVSRSVARLAVGMEVPEVVWVGDSVLGVVVVTDGGKGIAELGLDGRGEWVVGPGYRNIRDLVVDGGVMYFAMDSGGYSDVYSVGVGGGVVRREVRGRHGVRSPWVVGGGELMVSEYGSGGYRVVVARGEGVVVDSVGRVGVGDWGERGSVGEWVGVGFPRVHLVPNVHSWGPVVVDGVEQRVSAGLSVSSQNTHGTVWFQGSYNPWAENEAERVSVGATYNFMYPRLTLSGHWGHSDYDMSYYNSERGSRTLVKGRSRHSDVSVMASVPLTFNSGGYLRALTGAVSVRRQRSTGVSRYTVRMGSDSVGVYRMPGSRYTCGTVSLSGHILRRMSERDVGYRGGVSVSLAYDAAPWGNDYGYLLYGRVNVYLPSVFRYHQVALSLAGEHRIPGSRVSTGVEGESYERSVSSRVATPYHVGGEYAINSVYVRGAYCMPLVSPDWELGPVLYVKRLNLRLVSEHLFTPRHLFSHSLELWAETRPLLLPYPFSIGGRLTYVPHEGRVAGGVIVGIEIG